MNRRKLDITPDVIFVAAIAGELWKGDAEQRIIATILLRCIDSSIECGYERTVKHECRT